MKPNKTPTVALQDLSPKRRKLLLSGYQLAKLNKFLDHVCESLVTVEINSPRFSEALDAAEVLHSFLNELDFFEFLMPGGKHCPEQKLWAAEAEAEKRAAEYLRHPKARICASCQKDISAESTDIRDEAGEAICWDCANEAGED